VPLAVFKTVVRRLNGRRGWVRFPCASANENGRKTRGVIRFTAPASTNSYLGTVQILLTERAIQLRAPRYRDLSGRLLPGDQDLEGVRCTLTATVLGLSSWVSVLCFAWWIWG